jgi:hypothetical protein
VVAVAVAGEDMSEVLVAGGDPIADRLALLDGQRRLGQDGVVFTVDQRGGPGGRLRLERYH